MSMVVILNSSALLGNFQTVAPAFFFSQIERLAGAVGGRKDVVVLGPQARRIGAKLLTPIWAGIQRGQSLRGGQYWMNKAKLEGCERIDLTLSSSIGAVVGAISEVSQSGKTPWLMHVDEEVGSGADSEYLNQRVGLIRSLKRVDGVLVLYGGGVGYAKTREVGLPLARRLEGVNVGVMSSLPAYTASFGVVLSRGVEALPKEQQLLVPSSAAA